MYDTINFKLKADDVQGVDFLEETPCYIDDVAYHNYSGQEVVTGALGGLKVTITAEQVRVKDGSLCKWYLGDNYQVMGRGDTQRAIEKLSDTLHLPMGRATVTRMDVAQNIIVRHPPAVYLNHLGVLRDSTRLQEPSGLYYSKNTQRLCFYDKNREQRARGETIPELYRNVNTLRYEQRYTQRLRTQFDVETVTGALLYDEAFYIAVLRRWRDTYKSIEKINDITLNFSAMKNKAQLYKMGVLAMVERVGGEVEMIAHINEARLRGELTPKQAHDLRQAVKEACQIREGLTSQSEAVKELDKKIMEAVRFYR
ncbi:MAG: hypothetical protein LUC44_00740 [Prevotellaceae bacterium]|nr:hypothetical protein [Prevotellaceae bacterium]